MSCMFVPPYLLQRVALWAGTRHASASGKETLQVDDRLRARREAPPPELAAPRVPGVRTRVVHTANNTETLPGEPVRTDGDSPVGDQAVDEAFDSSGQVLDLFRSEFGRRSIDGRGGTVSITVHYGRDYDNAFWDGIQLVFGDGDGQIFERFTKPMDVMAHEFTHGVTQFTVGLAYQDQPGALNESISDVFASMAKQRVLGQTAAEADWLIGEGLFTSAINAKALRSMKEPGTAYDDPQIGRDLQVGSMADYVYTDDDSGGVHINSGIPNRAFVLAALDIGGASWEKAGQVWYDTLVHGELSAQASFGSFARATLSSARRLFPDDPSIAERSMRHGSRSACSRRSRRICRPASLSRPSPRPARTCLGPLPYVAAGALPAPRRSANWISTPIPRVLRFGICSCGSAASRFRPLDRLPIGLPTPLNMAPGDSPCRSRI